MCGCDYEWVCRVGLNETEQDLMKVPGVTGCEREGV